MNWIRAIAEEISGNVVCQGPADLVARRPSHLSRYEAVLTTFPSGALFGFGEPRSIATYGDMTPTSGELTDLLGLMAAGKLSAPVGLRGDWQDVDDAVRALFARKVHGKVVLDVV